MTFHEFSFQRGAVKVHVITDQPLLFLLFLKEYLVLAIDP